MDSPTKSWHARLHLGFARQGAERSVLADRVHQGPMRVLRPLYPEGVGICHVALLHPPSGIAGGDTVDLDITIAPGAHATLTTPGATRWYKAHGNAARQSQRLTVAAGALLDWLPLENILFDGVDATLETTVDLQPGARAIGWEIVQLGSIAQTGHWASGRARTRTELRRAGELLWVEQGALGASDPIRHRVTGLDGLPVYGTLWCHGPALDHATSEALAALLPWGTELRGGSTVIPSGGEEALTLVRALGLHTEDVRELLTRAWLLLRGAVLGVPGAPLRLWST